MERKVERFGWTFAPGDKVMQIENDYDKEVYNGDIGMVVDVDPEAGELTARFEGRDLVYGFGELDALDPAYAATVHKSQGSEYPAVVIPVLTQRYAKPRGSPLWTTGTTSIQPPEGSILHSNLEWAPGVGQFQAAVLTGVRRKLKKAAFALMTDCGGKIRGQYFPL